MAWGKASLLSEENKNKPQKSKIQAIQSQPVTEYSNLVPDAVTARSDKGLLYLTS